MKLRITNYNPTVNATYYQEVDSIADAVKTINRLREYNRFQFDNYITPNLQGTYKIEMFCNNKWCLWVDIETGIDRPDEYLDYIKSNNSMMNNIKVLCDLFHVKMNERFYVKKYGSFIYSICYFSENGFKIEGDSCVETINSLLTSIIYGNSEIVPMDKTKSAEEILGIFNKH